jgi:hypothetical protein
LQVGRAALGSIGHVGPPARGCATPQSLFRGRIPAREWNGQSCDTGLSKRCPNRCGAGGVASVAFATSPAPGEGDEGSREFTC